MIMVTAKNLFVIVDTIPGKICDLQVFDDFLTYLFENFLTKHSKVLFLYHCILQ